MKKIKDNFSRQSRFYSKYRPTYPSGLINHIITLCTETSLAWDCATGNGQIAFLLSDTFEKVIATDISKNQIEHSVASANIEYRVERAEESSFNNNSVDLITIGQGIHWFDFGAFYDEVNRVLKKDGVIAAVGYSPIMTSNLELNSIIEKFYNNILGPYWDEERKYVDENYTTIPFPFNEIDFPDFKISYKWTMNDIIGYFESWSSVIKYKDINNKNPLDLIIDDLLRIFSSSNLIEVDFKAIGRVGKLVSPS